MANAKRAGIFAGVLAALAGLVLIIKARAGTNPSPGPPPGPPPPPPAGMANLYGRVTDGQTGQPVAGATVAIGDYLTPTNNSGDYALVELTLGAKTVVFTANGYNPRSVEITLVEGNNSFNTTLEPVPVQPAGFSYSNVSAVLTSCNAAPAFQTGNFSARITNPNQVPLTLDVTLKWSYFMANDPYHVAGPYPLVTFVVNLQPGAFQDVALPGNDAPDSCRFIIAQHSTHNLWLEDENGKQSEVAQLRRE